MFVSDATWNSCQHGERDTQHVSDLTRHNMSRIRISLTLRVRDPPVNHSITGHCISTRNQDIDLKT